MKDENEDYIKEMQMLTEQRKAENEKAWNELALEKQRTRTERAKHGARKVYARLISSVVIIVILAAITTWLLSIFFPSAVRAAIDVFVK